MTKKRLRQEMQAAKPDAGKQQPRQPDRADSATPLLPRWLLMAACLLLAGGGTWAACEFVLWARVPGELVGKWVVEGGPQDGATFDFARNGSLEAHLNNNGNDHVLQAKVAVEDRTLHITTRNPHTNREETRSCAIRELTRSVLVVEFNQGEVYRMARAQ